MNNPYEILGVDQNAPMKDIVLAMTKAMRERKYSNPEITAARAQLSTPAKRLAADFTFPIVEAENVEGIPVPELDEISIDSFNDNKYDTL